MTEAAVPDIRVLLISGSTRAGSSNSLVLHRLHELRHPGTVTSVYDGLRTLPAFVPKEAVPATVRRLLQGIVAADALVFSTPEYAGGLPGAFKNLLDWTVGGGELYGKPVAWLDVANPGRGAGARAQLRTVLGYVGAHVVEDACTRVAIEAAQQGQVVTADGERNLGTTHAALVTAVTEARNDHDLFR